MKKQNQVASQYGPSAKDVAGSCLLVVAVQDRGAFAAVEKKGMTA